jgi:NAD(P)-dependent dehydrogenase (short-subunit alcohol dehydrogenase family)
MNQRLSGKLVLVAGGTGGLGRAVSVAFLEEGAKVVVTYRGQKEWDDLKGVVGANASSLAGRRIDVTDEAGWISLSKALSQSMAIWMWS